MRGAVPYAAVVAAAAAVCWAFPDAATPVWAVAFGAAVVLRARAKSREIR